MHRAKSILAALAAVALSATAVFAAAGTGPADAAKDGLAGAAVASGRSVPVRAESPDTINEHQANKAQEVNESPDLAKTTDANAAHPDNHGALVSVAAQKATPAEYANHGAYVRSIAMENHGHGAASAKTHGKSTEAHPAS